MSVSELENSRTVRISPIAAIENLIVYTVNFTDWTILECLLDSAVEFEQKCPLDGLVFDLF